MNRENYPGSAYPLSGDVQSQPGDTRVKVIGLQGLPIKSVILVGGEELSYDPLIGAWVPRLLASIQINNVTVSKDPNISVNVVKPVLVNGS